MGAILKGIQSVLIALGIIAVVGTCVILYYNTVKPEGEEAAAVETQAQTEMPSAETQPETTEETETTEDTNQSSDDTSSSVFSPENGHEHTYTETVLRPSTCMEPGEIKYTCYCGDSYVDSIPVLDHTPGQWVTVRAATATQTGLRQKSCNVCGRVIEEETLPMLAAPVATSTDSKKDNDKTDDHKHSYTYEISEEATCTEKGKKTYTCSTCGSTFETTIPATNHPSRKTVRTEGDCANPGKIEVKCNICDAIISSETLKYDHNWGSWQVTTAPTTTAEGVRTRTCKECGETQTKSISKLSGGSSGSNGGSGGSGGTGGNGGTGGSGSNGGSGGTAHTHSYTSSVTTQPTCEEAGVTTYVCSCGHSYTEPKPEALGHRPSGSWVTTKKATMEEEGERVQYCSRCNAVAKTEKIAKLEDTHQHTYKAGAVTKQPTCVRTGTRIYTCSCGAYYTSSIPATGHKDIEPLDHMCDTCGETISSHKDLNRDCKCDICGMQLPHDYNSNGICRVCGAKDPTVAP